MRPCWDYSELIGPNCIDDNSQYTCIAIFAFIAFVLKIEIRLKISYIFSYIILDEEDSIKHRAAVILTNVLQHDKFAAEEIVKSEIFDILTAYAAGKETCPGVVSDLAVDMLKMLVSEKFVEANDKGEAYRPQFQSDEAPTEVDEEVRVSGSDEDSDLD